MKKICLLLTAIILFFCTACSKDNQPAQSKIITEDKAMEILQEWLDEHPFDPPVSINEDMTAEDNSGFTFVLYQTKELAKIRVVKENGTLLYSRPEGNYISINDWYKNAPGKTEKAEHNTKESDSSVLTEDKAKALFQSWLNKHSFPFSTYIAGGTNDTFDGKEGYSFALFDEGHSHFTDIFVNKKTSELFNLEPGDTGITLIPLNDWYIDWNNWYAEQKEDESDTTASDNWIVGNYSIKIKGYNIERSTWDETNKPVLVITYEWTNNGKEPSSANGAFNFTLYQNDMECDSYGLQFINEKWHNIWSAGDDNFDKKIKPGTTLVFYQGYALNDTFSDIELEISEDSFFSSKAASTILKLK